MPLIG